MGVTIVTSAFNGMFSHVKNRSMKLSKYECKYINCYGVQILVISTQELKLKLKLSRRPFSAGVVLLNWPEAETQICVQTPFNSHFSRQCLFIAVPQRESKEDSKLIVRLYQNASCPPKTLSASS